MNFPTIVQVPVSAAKSPLNFAKNNFHSAVVHTTPALNKVKSAAQSAARHITFAFNHAGSTIKTNVATSVTNLKPFTNRASAKITQIQNSRFVAALPEKPTVQRILLVMTTALAVLSLIPPLRLGANIALRSVALLSSTTNCAESWSRSGLLSRSVKIAKIATVALGLAGLAAASPALIIASIGADIGIQSFEASKAICQRKPEKALIHLSAIVIDSFVLAGTATGSAPLMITAALTSSFVMTCLAAKALMNLETVRTNRDALRSFVDFSCYLALAVVSGMSATTIRRTSIVKYPKVVPNRKPAILINPNYKNGKIATPSQTVQRTNIKFDTINVKKIEGSNTLSNTIAKGGCIPPKKPIELPKKVEIPAKIIIEDLNPKYFPTLPLGGTVIVTHDLT